MHHAHSAAGPQPSRDTLIKRWVIRPLPLSGRPRLPAPDALFILDTCQSAAGFSQHASRGPSDSQDNMYSLGAIISDAEVGCLHRAVRIRQRAYKHTMLLCSTPTSNLHRVIVGRRLLVLSAHL